MAGDSQARHLKRSLRGDEMKYSPTKGTLLRVIVVCFVLLSLGALLTARTLKARTPTTSVNIVNNSSREIRNVYLSHVDADDWSDNQLGGATISAGQSYNLSVSPCDGQQMKVIGEDSDGCFVSANANCGDSSTWTITNDTTRDCGY
jgi:hypothetical protein